MLVETQSELRDSFYEQHHYKAMERRSGTQTALRVRKDPRQFEGNESLQ